MPINSLNKKIGSYKSYDVNTTKPRLTAQIPALPVSELGHENIYAGPNHTNNFNQILNLYIPLDMLAFLLSAALAWAIAETVNSIFFGRHILDASQLNYASARLTQFFAIVGATLIWFHHTGHYRVRMPFLQEANKIVVTLACAMMMDGFLQFATKQDFSRLGLISGWVTAAVTIMLLRILLRSVLRRNGRWQVSTLLVGLGETATNTQLALESDKSLGYEITAQIVDIQSAYLQARTSWKNICLLYKVDYVVIALDGDELERARAPMADLMRESIPFSISPPLHHLPVQGMMHQYFFNHNVMLLARNSGLQQPLPRLIKRLFDILVSGTALLVLSPVFLPISLMIKRDGGSAFFSHTRIGRHGKRFGCLKFRSMIANSAEVLQQHLEKNSELREEWNATQKLKKDPRITRLGNFLRRSSLDELPQLVNVLRGDMSLVGPRPIVAEEVRKYKNDIAYYYSVRPGITGVWQVSGRNDVSYGERVQMDSWYVRNWTLWHDVAILFKTLPALILKRGVY